MNVNHICEDETQYITIYNWTQLLKQQFINTHSDGTHLHLFI